MEKCTVKRGQKIIAWLVYSNSIIPKSWRIVQQKTVQQEAGLTLSQYTSAMRRSALHAEMRKTVCIPPPLITNFEKLER